MSNAINWFEIPATDFDRAVDFYRTVLGTELREEMFGETPNALFPTSDQAKVGGAIVKADINTQTLVYLNAKTPENLDQILARVEKSGGKVVIPKTNLGAPGYIAVIIDSEGNRVGLSASPYR